MLIVLPPGHVQGHLCLRATGAFHARQLHVSDKETGHFEGTSCTHKWSSLPVWWRISCSSGWPLPASKRRVKSRRNISSILLVIRPAAFQCYWLNQDAKLLWSHRTNCLQNRWYAHLLYTAHFKAVLSYYLYAFLHCMLFSVDNLLCTVGTRQYRNFRANTRL